MGRMPKKALNRYEIWFVLISAVLALLLASQNGCSLKPESSSPVSNNEPQNDGPIRVCELRTQSGNHQGEAVHVVGRLTGFHEFVLYDDSCKQDQYVVQLVFSSEMRRKLLENRPRSATTDLNGKIEVVGTFEPDAGLLYEYPARVVDASSPRQIEHPRKVDRIKVSDVMKFVPDNS